MSASVTVRLPSLAIFEEAESILEALPDGLLVTDSRGRIIYANVRLEHMSGYDRRELLDASVDLLVPDGFRAMHHDLRDRFCLEPTTRPMGTGLDTRLLRSDGTELPVQIQLSPTEIGGRPGVLAAVREGHDRTGDEHSISKREAALLLHDRELIARNLNAGVIHTLFGIGLHLQTAAANAPNAEVRKVMEQTVDEIDLAITQLRQNLFSSRSAESPA